jgi:hypothetical protein
MKKFFPVLWVLASLLLAGCAQRYIIITANGSSVTAYGKPRLKGGSYVYKDSQGREKSISSMRVREISPASDSGNSEFTPGSSK